MTRPAIATVIPVYNGEAYLESAVESAIRQTLVPKSVLIVDDGSTDGTPSLTQRLVRDHGGLVRCIRTKHRGVSAARNHGIAASVEPLVAFLDADDVWLPRKLEEQFRIIRDQPSVGLVHSSYEHIDERGSRLAEARVVPPRKRGNLFEALLFEDYVLSGSASSALVRREFLGLAGPFDERLMHGEDWDLWIRLAAVSDFDFSSEVLVQIRIHGESAQRTPVLGRGVSFALQRLYVYAKWEDEIRRRPGARGRLRQHLAMALLSSEPRISEVRRFYREAVLQGDPIFGSEARLWLSILRVGLRWSVFRHLVRRIARMLGGNH